MYPQNLQKPHLFFLEAATLSWSVSSRGVACQSRVRGQVGRINYWNGLTTNNTYDTLARIRATTLFKPGNSPLLSLNYQYNRPGTLASVTGQVNSLNVNENYRYDSLYRLTNATVTSNSATTTSSQSYDNAGNKMIQSINNQATGYVYNTANNELMSSMGQSASSYSYDQNGNLVAHNSSLASWAYTWDSAGNLARVTKNGTAQAAYAYDGGGRRLESSDSSTVFYAYFGTETLYEYNATSNASSDYVFAGGLRICRISASNINFYHTDALGSTRLVTDLSSNVVFSDGYQPFGTDNGTPYGTSTSRFAGKPVSQTTGLYYDYQRWYDPSIGRFISADRSPGHKANPQSLNLYLYVQDSPSTNTDPTGLDCFSNLSSFGGCAGGFLYDNTVGAAVNSYNWYQGASDRDKWAFWAGVGTAVGIGVLVGASCVFAGCTGLLLLGMGVLAGVGGSFGAADAYHLAGGQSECGLRASMFWGGIGGGAGFGLGEGVGGLVKSGFLPDKLPPPDVSAADVNPGTVFRLGPKRGNWFSDRAFGSVSDLEADFGRVPQPFWSNSYRITAQFGEDVSYRTGSGNFGAMQYWITSGSPNILSASFYSLAPAYVTPIASIVGAFTSSIPS
jgi:RHS repeat-associated protein